MGRVGVLRLLKSRNLAKVQFSLAVLTPDSSFVCVNSL